MLLFHIYIQVVKVRILDDFNASLQRRKCSSRSSVQFTCYDPVWPLIESSRGDIIEKYFGMHRDGALNASINDLVLLKVLRGFVDTRRVILCGVTDMVPDDHFQPCTSKLKGHK